MSHSIVSAFAKVGSRAALPAMVVCLLLAIFRAGPLVGQTGTASPAKASSADPEQMADIEHRLNVVTDALAQTQQTLQKSLLEIQTLRGQLEALRAQSAPGSAASPVALSSGAPSQSAVAGAALPSASDGPTRNDDIQVLREQVEMMQSEIKQHEQIKVETASKYPVRLTGLVLFNAFTNAGVADNADLPTLALPRQPGLSHGSTGATLSQTIVGVEATGPTIAGARSSADVSVDFFGGATTNPYGYSSTTGVVRMRESQVSLDWNRTTLQAAFTGPLISPLSPTSYATVAEPGFSASGNLWTWSPQLRVEQRIPLSEERSLALEGGLLFPQSPSYTSGQLDSPVEASRHPGYEGRLSFHDDSDPAAIARHFVFGVGGYSASQYYTSTTQVHSWAVTADWQAPLSRWFALTGEFYRGRALGGLGGGLYKDVLIGANAVTGLPQITGADTVGGWSQWKARFSPVLEANAGFGIDDVLAGSFDGLILTPGANPLQRYARNNSVTGNLIFRPKTYLILSPEYRHLRTWPYTGAANDVNIFTFSAGYQF